MLHVIDEALLRVFARVSAAAGRDRGQTLAEYGLLLTLVAVGVVIPTMLIFREQLIAAYQSASICLDGAC